MPHLNISLTVSVVEIFTSFFCTKVEPQHGFVTCIITLIGDSAFFYSRIRFTCRAKNPAGESDKAFDLNVLGITCFLFVCVIWFNVTFELYFTYIVEIIVTVFQVVVIFSNLLASSWLFHLKQRWMSLFFHKKPWPAQCSDWGTSRAMCSILDDINYHDGYLDILLDSSRTLEWKVIPGFRRFV